MTTIITGANHGLGYETAKTLAEDKEKTIVLAGRDLSSLGEAAGRIQNITGNTHLVPMHIDLGVLASVRAFVDEFRSRDLPPLDTLICNAGVSRPDIAARSADGYEETFAINHLGHFLLVHLLLESLQPPARIILVSSGAHDPVRAGGPMHSAHYTRAEWLAYPERDLEMLKSKSQAGGRAYANSKLCNILFTYELARRLEASGMSTSAHPITAIAFDPGLMAGTELGRNRGPWMRFVWYHLLGPFSKLFGFGRTAERSGGDLATLATAPELENVTGKYFSGREMIPSSEQSYDRELALDLWETSVHLAHLQPEESPLVDGEAG